MMKNLHFVLIFLATKQYNLGVENHYDVMFHVIYVRFSYQGFSINVSGEQKWTRLKIFYNLAQPVAKLTNNRIICCLDLSSRVWNFYPRYGISSHLLLTFKPLSTDNHWFTSIYMQYNLSCILYSVSLKLECTRINIFHHFCSHRNIGFISLWQKEKFVGFFKIRKIISFFYQLNFAILKIMVKLGFHRPKRLSGRLAFGHAHNWPLRSIVDEPEISDFQKISESKNLKIIFVHRRSILVDYYIVHGKILHSCESLWCLRK